MRLAWTRSRRRWAWALVLVLAAVALAAPTSADGERRMHPTQVVALKVAVHDVVAWRHAQDQGLAVVDVEAPGLVEKVDAGCLFVDRQPVALQRQLVRARSVRTTTSSWAVGP